MFRAPEHCVAVAEEAAAAASALGLKVFWMQVRDRMLPLIPSLIGCMLTYVRAFVQEGVINDEAASVASAAGLGVVQDRCVFVEAARRR